MKTYQTITDCDDIESDGFRKIAFKASTGFDNKDEKVLLAKTKFISSYMNKGVDEEYANYVWDKIIAFSARRNSEILERNAYKDMVTML